MTAQQPPAPAPVPADGPATAQDRVHADGAVTAARPRRHGGIWTALTVVELVLAVGAVLIDLFLPALVLVALAGVSLLVRRERFSTLGFHRLSPLARRLLDVAGITVAWTALMFLVVMPLVEHLTGERQDVSQFAELEGNVPLFLTLLALTWTLAAVGEELAFRGYLLTRFTDLVGTSTVARGAAIVVVAVLFALIHDEQGFAGMVLVFVDAVFYGVLRYAYRSLWAPVVAHGLGNTIGLTAYFLMGPVQTLW